MRGPGSTVGALLIPLSMLAACSDERMPTRYSSPVESRVSAILEPPSMGLGDVARLEVSVVTPPGHRPQPYQPPTEVPGFWILETEALPAQTSLNRRIQRTQFRIRAREVGSFRWPGASVEVEAPDGSVNTLLLEPLPLEVTSVLPSYPDRMAPFGLPPPLVRPSGDRHLFWAGAGVGATGVLAGLGLVWLARRQRRIVDPPVSFDDPPWVAALEALEVAGLQIEEDPLGACQAIAAALRVYVAARYRADVNPRTTEELECATPPFAATSRWPTFVAILRRLDGLRFTPADAPTAFLRRGAREACSESDRFVRETTPHESLR